MDANLIANATAVAFSLVAIIVSALIAVRQSKLMQHANLLPILVDMFREFADPRFKQHLAYIERELWEEFPPENKSITDLTEEVRSSILPVMNFFANLGGLALNGIISDIMAASYVHGSALAAWARLEPYIRNERRKRADETYYLFFEHLASVISEYPPAVLKTRLRTKSMPVRLPQSSEPEA